MQLYQFDYSGECDPKYYENVKFFDFDDSGVCNRCVFGVGLHKDQDVEWRYYRIVFNVDATFSIAELKASDPGWQEVKWIKEWATHEDLLELLPEHWTFDGFIAAMNFFREGQDAGWRKAMELLLHVNKKDT